MIGCRVAKYHGKNLRFGYVKDYLPPAPGKAEPSWTVRYGEDSDKDEIEELGRLELNKQLNLQKTAGWETSPVCDHVQRMFHSTYATLLGENLSVLTRIIFALWNVPLLFVRRRPQPLVSFVRCPNMDLFEHCCPRISSRKGGGAQAKPHPRGLRRAERQLRRSPAVPRSNDRLPTTVPPRPGEREKRRCLIAMRQLSAVMEPTRASG